MIQRIPFKPRGVRSPARVSRRSESPNSGVNSSRLEPRNRPRLTGDEIDERLNTQHIRSILYEDCDGLSAWQMGPEEPDRPSYYGYDLIKPWG